MTPVKKLSQWIQEERETGAPNPQHAVLSTATNEGVPHARVVALREVNEDALLFFTQRGTRKVAELEQNSKATMTFWFECLLRSVNVEGVVEALSDEENEHYWRNYPREAQIRFHSYSPTSSQPIQDKQMLEEKRQQLELTWIGQPVPYTPLYCGFRLKPSRFVFYAYRSDVLSDVVEYSLSERKWVCQLLSP